MERRWESILVSRSRLRLVALVVALAVLAGVIAVAAVATKRVFDNAIIVDAWPMPTDATATATDNGVVGNRWTAWHGLPLPEDFVLVRESLAGDPDLPPNSSPQTCTQADFRYEEADIAEARQRIAAAWGTLGLVPYQRSSGGTDWYARDGRFVATRWGGLTYYPFGEGLRVWECPKGRQPIIGKHP